MSVTKANQELLVSDEHDDPNAGVLAGAHASRQLAEVQSAMVIAKRFPRDETAAMARIMQSCKRKGLAERSMYTYTRGSTKIQGPSIRLAEAMAQAWGNLDFGIVELEQRVGESVVMSYCIDLETNTRQTKVFTVKHSRKAGGEFRSLVDPRDIYEMVANQGARRLRACILGVMPGDIVDEAVSECKRTLQGNNNEPLIDRVRVMVNMFADEFGVSKEMIEKKLGHSVDVIDEFELTDLRGIYQSLKDQMSTRATWFDVNAGQSISDEMRAASQSNAAAATAPPPSNEPVDDNQVVKQFIQLSNAIDDPEAIRKAYKSACENVTEEVSRFRMDEVLKDRLAELEGDEDG